MVVGCVDGVSLRARYEHVTFQLDGKMRQMTPRYYFLPMIQMDKHRP